LKICFQEAAVAAEAMKKNVDAPIPSSRAASRRMESVRSSNTSAELKLRAYLHKIGLRYRVHQLVSRHTRCRPDLVFKRARVVVFVDGCFWHSCPRHRSWPAANAQWWREKIEANCERDRRLRRQLRRAGWRVVRVWEHEKPEVAARRIYGLVRKSDSAL
jgi:DNA mismatch endonuclease (patch repair protein)